MKKISIIFLFAIAVVFTFGFVANTHDSLPSQTNTEDALVKIGAEKSGFTETIDL